ncbi:hypothetical protein MTYP_02300 [Methylophilaceae bacterium]|nr:hypothetical protein MTYP_02300 [Methylophilaceae bacterium]
MHKSKLKRVTLAVCFVLLPVSAYAAGLGKLTVISGLGEPLLAEIDLVSTTPEELSSLSASIAPPEAYAVQGIERSAIHNAIQVEVAKAPSGAPILKLSSRQPVSDPFLDMLIQVDWATGRLLREYTVLLDPPGYSNDQATVSPVITPAPVTIPAARPGTSAAPSAATGAAPSSPPQEYKTRPGDTLNKIAREMRVEGVSLDQMLVGIYRTNQQAFDGSNMNRLKVGQIIRAPSQDELAGISRQEAAKEIRVQTADWNAYRNRLAGIVAESVPTAEGAGNQAASGKLKAATEDRAAAESGPRDVVKLSKSEGVADAKAIQDKLNAMQEENVARQNSLNEANERVAALERQIADLQKLLAIKNETLAGLQNSVAEPTEAVPEPVAPASQPEEAAADAGEVAPEAAPVDEQPVASAEPAKPAVAQEPVAEPGILDSMADNSLLLGGAGGAVAVLAGAWLFLRNRRKRNLDSFEQGILTAGGLKANTVFGNTSGGTVDTGDTSFLTDFSQSPSGMIDTHDVDPIAEAEVYMAYGRETQAEEILNDAIAKEPTRYELHLKLLEIFAGRNDTSAFEAIAGELYSTLGSSDPVWVKVAEMGHQMEPANPLYDLSQAHVAAAKIDAVGDTLLSPTIPAGDDSASAPDMTAEAESPTLDYSFDVGSAQENAGQNAVSEIPDTLDFDLGLPSSEEPAPVAESDAATTGASDNSLDFAFEPSLSVPEEQPDAPEIKPADAGRDDTLIFDAPDFDQKLPDLPEFTSEPVADIDTEIGLDAGGLKKPEIAPDDEPLSLSSANQQESSLDFNLDLDVTEPSIDALPAELNEVESGSASTEPAEIDYSNITLELNAQDAPDVEEITITHDESEEVNTKLDLVTAYMDMGDSEGARELLEEVLQEGGPGQRERAQQLLNSLA